MRAVLFLIAASILQPSLCPAQSAATGSAPVVASSSPPDFSGTWTLDTERSWIAAPEKDALPDDTLILHQTATTLTFEGDPAASGRTESITLAGRSQTRREGGLYEVASKWQDGRLFVTTGFSRREAHRYAVLVWSLSPDGSELTLDGSSLDRDFSRPNQIVSSQVTTHRVYRRQH